MAKPLFLLPLGLVALAGTWVASRPYSAVEEIEQAQRLLWSDRSLVEWSGGRPDATHVRTSMTPDGRFYRFNVSRGDDACLVEVMFPEAEPAPHPAIVRRQGPCEEHQRLGHNVHVR